MSLTDSSPATPRGEAADRKRLQRVNGWFRSLGLKHRDFTIISNNCFAGWVYQRFGIPYRTPTVGLYFMAEDFLKLLGDLPRHLKDELDFISPEDSRYRGYLTQAEPTVGQYPVGLLSDDIEVHFLHYANETTARAKWRRRAARVNWDRLIVKFSNQNLCGDHHVRTFDALPFAHKICFTSRPFPECASVVFLKESAGQSFVSGEKRLYNRYLPIKRYINAMP